MKHDNLLFDYEYKKDLTTYHGYQVTKIVLKSKTGVDTSRENIENLIRNMHQQIKKQIWNSYSPKHLKGKLKEIYAIVVVADNPITDVSTQLNISVDTTRNYLSKLKAALNAN